MDHRFWIEVWEEGEIRFHQKEFNRELLRYFPEFQPKPGERVLVPLCGKTRDLLWLESRGLDVHGVEIAELAVNQFFEENAKSPPTITDDPPFKHFDLGRIRISVGDFFKLGASEKYDYVYDRASIVALPEEMRKSYAEVVKRSVKKGGKILLLSCEYAPGDLEGPPFSVESSELRRLFGDSFEIQLLESRLPDENTPRLTEAKTVKLTAFALSKKTDGTPSHDR